MKHARKMVIIPAEQYENDMSLSNHKIQNIDNFTPLRSKLENGENNKLELNSIQTPGDNLSRLDSEMHNILFSTKFNNEYEKSKNYLQVLRRYLYFKENEIKEFQNEENVNTNETINDFTTIENEKSFTNRSNSEDNFSKDSIINSVPKSYQKRAKQILENLNESGKIQWDENGVTTIDGSIISNSNIKDLLNHLTRKRVSTDDPAGAKELVRFIYETDAPINLIGNNDIIKQLKELSTSKKSNISNKSINLVKENKKSLWITT